MEQTTNTIVLSEQEQKYIKGWSWAGFLVPWLFLFVNKQNKLAYKILALFIFVYLLQLIPYLGIIIPSVLLSLVNTLSSLNLVYFGLAIWIAIKGKEISWDSGKFTSFEEFKTKQSTAIKFAWIFIGIYMISSMALFVNFMSTYIKDPQILNKRIYEQSLSDVKSKKSNINESDFKNGYDLGFTEGDKTSSVVDSSIIGQSNSYK